MRSRSAGRTYRHAAPKRPLREAARAIRESLGETTVILCDSASRGGRAGGCARPSTTHGALFGDSDAGSFKSERRRRLKSSSDRMGGHMRPTDPPARSPLAADQPARVRRVCRSDSQLSADSLDACLYLCIVPKGQAALADIKRFASDLRRRGHNTIGQIDKAVVRRIGTMPDFEGRGGGKE